ncbi:MAG: MotA/TolQ/ExbB proton channel family protein [Oligoflexus sp.]
MLRSMRWIPNAVFSLVIGLSGIAATSAAMGQEMPQTLDQLLERVKRDRMRDQQVNQQREQEFLKAKNQQAEILKKARAELAAEKKRADQLKSSYDNNEKELAELEDRLRVTMGTLGELFGVVRQVAGDTKGQFENSLVTAQYPGRASFVDELSRRKELPETEDLEKLWIELLSEMTESGKVVDFTGKVTKINGEEVDQTVTRIGVFNLLSDGVYLQYLPEVEKMVELGRQPQGRYLSLAEDFQSAAAGTVEPVGIDPSRGSILSLLVQAPSLWERFQQGGIVGYVIAMVLIIGLVLVVERFAYLSSVGAKVKRQLVSSTPDPSNPLGKIFSVFEEYKDKDIETLELKLDEAIIKGTSSLERGLSTIKILAAVAPLLGLLGTVTGMIGTFQSITLFGTGDPKLMAGGISQALVTTVLGLIAAIPLILLHSMVASKSKSMLSILEEQSAGLMAQKVETEARA